MASKVSNNQMGLGPTTTGLYQVFRLCLVLVCLIIPFQRYMQETLNLSPLWQYLDESCVALVLALGFLAYCASGKVWRPVQRIAVVLGLFCLWGIVSGTVNRIPAKQNLLGTMDYVKNFLPIVLLPAIPFRRRDLYQLYRLLLALSLFIALFALVQELCWNANIDSPYLGVRVEQRFGLWRTPSCMGHPNCLGLYSVLLLILHFAIRQKLDWKAGLLILSIFLCGSKIAWASALATLMLLTAGQAGGVFRSRIRKAFLIAACLLIVVKVAPIIYQATMLDFATSDYYRGYALYKSLEIWKDHPCFGTGPGTYGGPVSLVFNSPVYYRYKFAPQWLEYVQNLRSLDQFWGQCLAETGPIGCLLFLGLIHQLYLVPRRLSSRVADPMIGRLLSGLSVVPVVLLFYSIGSGLNMAFFLLTYSILLGLCLGAARGDCLPDEVPADPDDTISATGPAAGKPAPV